MVVHCLFPDEFSKLNDPLSFLISPDEVHIELDGCEVRELSDNVLLVAPLPVALSSFKSLLSVFFLALGLKFRNNRSSPCK